MCEEIGFSIPSMRPLPTSKSRTWKLAASLVWMDLYYGVIRPMAMLPSVAFVLHDVQNL